jgi:hypothetical protein
MRNQPIDLSGGTLTIAQGATATEWLDMRGMPLSGISIFGPAALTGTISIEVTSNLNAENPSDIVAVNLQSGGADIVIGVSECVPLDFICWHGLRLSSGSAEAEARVFKIMGVEDLT